MSLPIVLRSAAEEELTAAFDWYNARRAGLGRRFVAAVQSAFTALAANPRMHAVVMADVRKAVVRGFPYCVYYRPHDDRIEVISVFHTSRDPAEWQSRI